MTWVSKLPKQIQSVAPEKVAMLLFVAMQILSVLAFQRPAVTLISLALIFFSVTILAARRLDLAFLVVGGELLVGSAGHALVFTTGQGVTLSLRLALFLAVFVGWGWHWWRAPKKVLQTLTTLPRALLFLPVVLGGGIVLAWGRGFAAPAIFTDVNNWLFFLLFFPAATILVDAPWRERAVKIFWAGIIFLGIKSALYFLLWGGGAGLSQLPETFLQGWYNWERTLFLSQLTPLAGPLFRIYFWSNLFSAIGLVVFALWYLFGDTEMQNYGWWGFVAALVSVILTGSRSFWLGILLAFFGVALILLFARLPFGLGARPRYLKIIGVTGVVVIVILSVGAALRPWRGSGVEKDLLAWNDPGVNNRAAQLPVLWTGIKEHWLFGSGFGRELQYVSTDPRQPGQISTSAFELGYLDNWLKVGVVGLGVLLWLVGEILWTGLKNLGRADLISSTLTLGLLVLLATHLFSPYLHHPLGIGYLILVWLINKKYVAV